MTPRDRLNTSLEFAQRSDQEFDNGGRHKIANIAQPRPKKPQSCATRTSSTLPGSSTGCRETQYPSSDNHGCRNSPPKVATSPGELTLMRS